MYGENHQELERPILLPAQTCRVGSIKPEEGRRFDGGMGVRLSHSTLGAGEPSTRQKDAGIHYTRWCVLASMTLGKGTTEPRSLQRNYQPVGRPGN
jgi:hypothetical protein